MPFRFFDLPGEVRNKIYEEAFAYSGPNSGMNVALLRTCKQANIEGKGIFEVDNCFTLVVKFSGEAPSPVTAEVSGDVQPVEIPSVDLSILGFTAALPNSTPRTAARMRVVVQSSQANWDAGHVKACTRFLFALVSWLNSLAGGPHHLTLVLENLYAYREDSPVWENILGPLNSLLPRYGLDVQGLTPAETQKHRTSNREIVRMTSPTPVQDFLRFAPLMHSRLQHPHMPASIRAWGIPLLNAIYGRMDSNRTILNPLMAVLGNEFLAEMQLLEAFLYEPNNTVLLKKRLEALYFWILQHEREMGFVPGDFLETRMRNILEACGESEEMAAVMGKLLSWFPQELDE